MTGGYTLEVTSGVQTVTDPVPFPVVAATGAGNPLEIVLTPPSLVRAGGTARFRSRSRTPATTTFCAPLLDLTTDGATLKLPSQIVFQGSSLWFLAISPTGPAGTLTPGESVQEVIQFQSTTNNGTINFQLNQADDSQPMDWAAQEAALQPSTIPAAAWPVIFANFTANVGSTVASYHAALAADATYMGQIGEPTSDVGQLVQFEILKADNAYFGTTLANITADALPTPGVSLSFEPSYLQPIADRYYQDLLGLGWTTNWDISAQTLGSGDAQINVDSPLYAAKLADGSYEVLNASGVTLTSTNGEYRLQTTQGSYQFNPNGTLAYVEDGDGNRIVAAYNPTGQLVSLTHSNGTSFDLAYNAQGRLATLTDSHAKPSRSPTTPPASS